MDLLREAAALGLLGLDDPHLELRRQRRQLVVGDERGVATLEEQPRALEVSDRELQAGQLGLVDAELGPGATGAPAPGGGRGAGAPRLGRGRGPCVGGCAIACRLGHAVRAVACVRQHPGLDVVLEAGEVVPERLPAPELLEVRGSVAVANAAEAVRRVAERLVRLGVQLVVPAHGRLRAGGIHRAECIGAHGYGRSRSAVGASPTPATPLHAMRNTRTFSIAATSSGSGGIGSRTSWKPVASGSGPSRTAGHEPRSGLDVMSHWAPNVLARSRTSAGVSSGRPRVRTRWVSASQIGKSWITGALSSSGAPIAAIWRARTSYVRAVSRAPAPTLGRSATEN